MWIVPYNADVKSWDVIIIGGGIIGLSLAIALRKQGMSVLVVERGEPGREASYAAAGMLAPLGPEIPPTLVPLALESASMYPEFVHQLSDESGMKIDFREEGTLLVSDQKDFLPQAEHLTRAQLSSLEPALRIADQGRQSVQQNAEKMQVAFLQERSVDPRDLMAGLIKAAKHRDVDISSGTEARSLVITNGRAAGVQTDRTLYRSGVVVNCAGSWAANIAPVYFPVRPVKGQMLCVIGGPSIRRVIRSKNVYLVPRSDGRMVIGSTLEEAGFDKRTDVDTIEKLLGSAVAIVPALATARQNETWAGLRPATPDSLPILGKTHIDGYFIASGHYRDGILLAPATAQALTDTILGKQGESLTPFSPNRFV